MPSDVIELPGKRQSGPTGHPRHQSLAAVADQMADIHYERNFATTFRQTILTLMVLKMPTIVHHLL